MVRHKKTPPRRANARGPDTKGGFRVSEGP
jgi:hypothetical protein